MLLWNVVTLYMDIVLHIISFKWLICFYNFHSIFLKTWQISSLSISFDFYSFDDQVLMYENNVEHFCFEQPWHSYACTVVQYALYIITVCNHFNQSGLFSITYWRKRLKFFLIPAIPDFEHIWLSIQKLHALILTMFIKGFFFI